MKFLTKIVMVVALATFSFQSFAQTFGVKAGMNMSKVSDLDDAKMLFGFHVGPTVEIELMDAVSVETGLLLSTKGVKNEYTSDIIPSVKATYTNKFAPMYLEIPINAKYALDLGGQKLYFAAGPYIGIGIGGKDKTEIDLSEDNVTDAAKEAAKDLESDEKIKWGDDGSKRMDFGMNIGAGIDLGSIAIGVQYGLGLSEIAKDAKPKHRVIGVSVAYKLSL